MPVVTPSAASIDTVKAVPFLVAVARHHRRQLELFTALARERQADQATAETGHEVDGFGRDVVRRQHQVTFVFAVFFIDQDHDAAGAHVGHDVFDRGNGHRGQGCRGVHAVSLGSVGQAALSMRST